MSFVVTQRPSLAVVFLRNSVRGYLHNTRLNMLVHIPSNPEHTVIRGDWASYHCDRTNTCHWSTELCKGVWVREGLRSREEVEVEVTRVLRIKGFFEGGCKIIIEKGNERREEEIMLFWASERYVVGVKTRLMVKIEGETRRRSCREI